MDRKKNNNTSSILTANSHLSPVKDLSFGNLKNIRSSLQIMIISQLFMAAKILDSVYNTSSMPLYSQEQIILTPFMRIKLKRCLKNMATILMKNG
jgi:hypothetical protein